MKSTGTIQAGTGLWESPNTSATNVSGFTGLPGGYRDGGGGTGTFNSIGFYGTWWSSSEGGTTYAYNRFLYYNYGYASRGYDNEKDGFAVRCLRD